MKRLLPAVIAVLVLAAIGTAFWLADRSAPIPAAMPSTAPAVGSCWNVDERQLQATLPWPGHAVPCASAHNYEIFYRGQVDHSLIGQLRSAKGVAVPATTVLMDGEARRGCIGHANAYVGGAWRSAQITIVPAFITPQRDGFYGCAVAQVSDPAGAVPVTRTASLAGALAAPDAKAYDIDCLSGTGTAATFTPCTKDHTGEFVGLYTVTPLGAAFNGPELQGVVTGGCQTVLNQFLSLPSGAANRSDLRSSYVGPVTSAEWLGSDQTYACYAYATSTMRVSVKGLGTRPLPH